MKTAEFIGYDARFVPSCQMHEERKGVQFLRRSDVIPLSVDQMIWRSPLESISEDNVVTYWGLYPPFWESIEQLVKYCKAQFGDMSLDYLLVFRVNGSDDLQINWSGNTEEWLLLGFDVADEGFISGLSNCGHSGMYDDTDRWSPYLNRHHLFNDPGPAMEFKLYVDDEVSEHAPFFVYALFGKT